MNNRSQFIHPRMLPSMNMSKANLGSATGPQMPERMADLAMTGIANQGPGQVAEPTASAHATRGKGPLPRSASSKSGASAPAPTETAETTSPIAPVSPAEQPLKGAEKTPTLPPFPPAPRFLDPWRTSGSSGRSSTRPKQLRQMGKRKMLITLVVSLLVVLLVIGFSLWHFRASATPNVTVYTVGDGTAHQSIGGGGIIFPRQQLDISYPVAERVIAVNVKAGDAVSQNQALIQLDPSELNAEITLASNDMAAAQAYLNIVSTNGNPLLIAQAQQAYTLAKNKYNELVAEASSPTLHHGTLISPMKGVVTSVNVNAGEVFSADTPLLTIMDESTLIVHMKVPLSNLGQVHVGQLAQVTPSALPDLNVNGKVIAIVPQADPQTDTFEVWVEVINTNNLLLPGMSAFVHIQNTAHALLVPRLAVLDVGSGSAVFVVRDSRAYVQPVHVIGHSIDAIIIDSGITIGDTVVLIGLDGLQNGQTVYIADTVGKMGTNS